jgi:glycerophosphoryl diester phosphodiesterase
VPFGFRGLACQDGARVQQRLPRLLDDTILFAHRGARAHAPENTIAAFELALEMGATGLESDVWLTRDGVPVLIHDGELGRRLRKRKIADMRREELPPHIPTLDELIDACGTDYELSLDLKSAQAGQPVINVVGARSADLLRRTWLCHPDLSVLAALRPSNPRVKLVHSTRITRLVDGAERHAARLADADIDCVNMRKDDWNGGLVALFHRFERAVFAWDLQFEHELRAAIRMGCDGMFSDWVDLMTTVYRDELESPETEQAGSDTN